MTVVVLTALELEHRAFRKHLTRLRTVVHPAGTIFDIGEVTGSSTRIALAVTGPGNTGAGILAERAIAMFAPTVVVVVGVAGSLFSEVKLGDVVFATRVYFYHGGLEDPAGFAPRPAAWHAPHRLEQLARHVSRSGRHRGSIHFRPIAAGDVVLNSLDGPLIGQIRRNYNDAAAVEMESAGLHQAGHLNDSLPVLTVRGISDRADGQKYETDRRGSQQRAAAAAAAFTVKLCRALPVEPPPSRSTPTSESLRVSVAVLLRVQDDDRFVLFHSTARPGAYGPPGGVVKYLPTARQHLDELSFHEEPRQNPNMRDDLRGFLPAAAWAAFLAWWRSSTDRESATDCLRRELMEEFAELGRPELGDGLGDIPFVLVRSVVDGQWSVPARPYDQIRVIEVYDLGPGNRRAETARADLGRLADDPEVPNAIWARRIDIEYGRSGLHYVAPQSAFLIGERRINADLPMVR